MSRYIDVDSLTSALNERYDTLVKDYGYYDAFALGFGDCVDKVENQPTADVVEVVRCKDCVYARKDKPTDTFFDCDFHGRGVTDTDYCKWGKRCEE